MMLLCGQKHATVRSSVLEVLLEITKYCDLYLMERILDDESQVCAFYLHSSIFKDSKYVYKNSSFYAEQ